MTSVAYTREQTSAEGDREIKTITLDNKRKNDRLKAGVSIGYPLGVTVGYPLAVTVGYRLSNFIEINGLEGFDYNSFTAGGSVLFTIFNIDISGSDFPLSVGPAFYAHFNKEIEYDVLAAVRFEYSFEETPINLFVEAGGGLRVVKELEPVGSLAIGIRYIF